ncbi:hypothetical protein GCM10007320_10470 [Pseudorhodoferax aquiterrae]|uniref:Uncharacterized protein n=1 Tax=Pseudorhodoferax aquiterrae TaxID=747304 RepID=A0ABQ3FWZ1_9BURK|nr:hypothetical protein [Pseudorhodoferax aquiterrae]GHC73647.1 hypothetical protein GCM10007320_10470 [Pseudorhodoferax aquiterrae]
MKTLTLFAALALAGAAHAQPAHSHGAGHDHQALHGGVVVEASDMDFELVAKPDTIALYVRDHGKAVELQGATGKLTLLAGSAKTEAPLLPAGDRLEAKGSFPTAAGTKVVATVQLAGRKPANLRFALK